MTGVVGLLCLAGALFSAIALPGNRFVAPADRESTPELVDAAQG